MIVDQEKPEVNRDSAGRKNRGSETPVGIFHDAYRSHYTDAPIMDAKAKRNIHLALHGQSPEEIREVIDDYLMDEAPFFRGHPAALFSVWLRQKMARLVARKAPERPPDTGRPAEEIEESFVGSPEEKARAVAWAKAHP